MNHILIRHALARLFFLSTILTLASCSDEGFENTLQPETDIIALKSDSFVITNSAFSLTSIPSKISDDTLLLGTYTADTIGTTKGSILMQFAAPGKITIPSIITDSSLSLSVSFGSICSNIDSTLKVKIHKMIKPLDYRTSYANNMDVTSYVGNEIADTTFKISSTTTSFTIPLNKLVKEFTAKIRESDGSFASTDAFTQYFPGLYIETQSGSDALLSVTSANLTYNYSYENKSGSEVTYAATFPASKNVRQVNIIQQTPENVSLINEYMVMSPGNSSMKLTIPLDSIKKRMGITAKNGIAYVENGLKKMAVSSATLSLPIGKIFSIGKPTYLLLVKESEYETFMKNTSMPDNVNEILGTFNSTDSTYTFTLKYYIADVMKKDSFVDEDREFVLIPVESTTNSSGTIIGIVHDSSLHAITIKKSSVNPISLSIVTSGW